MSQRPPLSGPSSESAGAEAQPSPEEILAELELVAGSDVFAGAARQQRLLRHLVTRRLNGSLGDLKEYTQGVEVFDRGEDFDPRLDPIVRVDASRLRSRLQRYYDGAGAGDPVRIKLPRGAYVPAFTGPPAPVVEPVSVPEQPPAPPLVESQPAPAAYPGRDPASDPGEHPSKDIAIRPHPGRAQWAIAAAALAIVAIAVYLFALLRHPSAPAAIHFTRFNRNPRWTKRCWNARTCGT